MKTVFALDGLPPSLFLAGPTPRKPEVLSWRVNALDIIADLESHGTVYVPEASDWASHDHYDAQVHWEWMAIEMSTVIVFWIPRDLETLPAFTTNVEFGKYINSGKTMYGRPANTPKTKYLDEMATRFGVAIYDDLRTLLSAACLQAEFNSRRASRWRS